MSGPRFMRQMTVEDGSNNAACPPSSDMIDPESEELPPQPSFSPASTTSDGSSGSLAPPGFPGLRIMRQVTVENGNNEDASTAASTVSPASTTSSSSSSTPSSVAATPPATTAPPAYGGGGLLKLRRHVTVAAPNGDSTSDNPTSTSIDPDSDELPPMAGPPGVPAASGVLGSPLFARQDTVGQPGGGSGNDDPAGGIDPNSEDLPPQPSFGSSSGGGSGGIAPPGFPGLRIARQVTVEQPSGDDSSVHPSHDPDSDDLPPQPATLSTPAPSLASSSGGSSGSSGLRLTRHVTVADASGRTSSDDPVGGHTH